MKFKIGYVDAKAARFAVERWHYTKCLPTGKLFKFGIWEDDIFIGVIIYSYGACPQIASPFNLDRLEVCELTRIALKNHVNPVSKFMAITLKILKKEMPTLKMIVSYADPDQGHNGAIYQASNWIYLGETKSVATCYLNKYGKKIHSKTLKTGRKGFVTKLLKEGKITPFKSFKHKYIYPLNKDLREIWIKKNKPYPMRISNNKSNSSGVQPENGVQDHLSAHLTE